MNDIPQPQAPDPTAAVPPPPTQPPEIPPAQLQEPAAGNDPVMDKLSSAAALATALAQNPEVLKFMTALVGAGEPQS